MGVYVEFWHQDVIHVVLTHKWDCNQELTPCEHKFSALANQMAFLHTFHLKFIHSFRLVDLEDLIS